MAVDASAIARTVGIQTTFQDLRAGNILFLPQRIAVIGQGSSAASYPTTKVQYSSAADVGSAFGFGSPLHLAALQLLPANGDGVGSIPVTFYPLEDDVSGVAATGDITPSGTATRDAAYQVSINGIVSESFVITTTDNVAAMTAAIEAAISATLNSPMTATDNGTDVGLEAKWAGASTNALFVEVLGPTDAGITFAITQPTGGLIDPDAQPALDQVGDVWETMFLNCITYDNTVNLDIFQTFGEGRWDPLVKKPCVFFYGSTESDVNTAITVPDARSTDRINCQLVAPGSVNLPFVVAARELARIAPIANNNPPRDYARQAATGLIPGTDGEQWTYAERDQAVKAGSSTIEVRDGVITLSDTVTMYHPTGEPFPAYRYVNDIVKLQNIIYNTNLIFDTPEWDGAPLIPDNQPTVNPDAKQPKAAKAAIAAMIDSLAENAIISDADFSKRSIVAQISPSNPKRLDLQFTVKLSGNNNITAINLDFGFFFGTAVAA